MSPPPIESPPKTPELPALVVKYYHEKWEHIMYVLIQGLTLIFFGMLDSVNTEDLRQTQS